jgi:biopolymer transport protein ExbD
MDFRRKNRERQSVSINLTSLIDVVLLLLIFFMISTTFILHPGLKVNLPSSSVEEIAQEEEDIIVVVTADNSIMIADEYFSSDTLYEKLLTLKNEQPEANLIIQADETANHGTVVEVLDNAKRTGFTKLSIATRRKE